MFLINKKEPTRNNSILDVIYTNKPEKIIKHKVYEDKEGSYHSPVLVVRSLKNKIDQQIYSSYRDFTNYN